MGYKTKNSLGVSESWSMSMLESGATGRNPEAGLSSMGFTKPVGILKPSGAFKTAPLDFLQGWTFSSSELELFLERMTLPGS